MKKDPHSIKGLIIRHRKENLRKCSLRGLENRSDLLFVTYPCHPLPCLSKVLLLSFNGQLLSQQDAIEQSGLPLVLIDGTWSYAKKMTSYLENTIPYEHRSLPPDLKTAYPRKQTHCDEPSRGLASIEALFAAYSILGYDTKGLLSPYHWEKEFLTINHLWIQDTLQKNRQNNMPVPPYL